ncbi:hypothetical protein, conserved [Plasmodium gonderi]|uniref:Clathrin light chain n=1 Tax=Plasmodium gonderi TaxID=77519 RepID=A0A1Y1JKC2_PLAGO|nr:hypothetical protein, conserved [Plasmodium gonderi]GAW82881.1 hypothetical protein, conserved [Plasmodium gonderi]
MSEMNDFDQFNLNAYDDTNRVVTGEKNIMNNGERSINEELGLSNELNDNHMEEDHNYNHINMSLNSIYSDMNVTKREIEESYSNSSNNYKFGDNKVDSSNNCSMNKYDSLFGKEKKLSFENSYEQFYEKESDISDTEVSTTWQSERLKRIEERKEYEKNKKIEIKKKAAADLKKWYEEMAILIEEKKKLSKKKINEEKRKEENLENKTWLKISQYLDLDKGEYFKENSRMKQVLLKLMKSEGS